MEAITVHRKKRRAPKSKRSTLSSHLALFCRVWAAVEAEMESRWAALTRQTDAELVQALRRAAAQWSADPSSRAQLAAAVLYLGVNTPDHALLFRRLRRTVAAELTPHVVCLRASHAGTTRALMRQLVRRLVPPAELAALGLSGPLQLSLHAVEAWYARSEAGAGARPVVLLLEDCERFPPAVLQDLVAVGSGYAARLPLLLVLGAASHPGVLHGLLGSVAASRLRLHAVRAPSPALCRRRVLEPLLLPAPGRPFAVGARVRALLLDALFGGADFSAANFRRRLRACLLEHLLRFPATAVARLAAALDGRGDGPEAEALRAEERRCAGARWLAQLLRGGGGAAARDLHAAALTPGGLAAADLFRRCLAQWLRQAPERIAAAVADAAPAAADAGPEAAALAAELTAALAEPGLEEGPAPAPALADRMSLQQLREGLKALHSRTQRPADALRRRLRDILEARTPDLCPAPARPSANILTVGDADALRTLLDPAQRADLQAALARPSIYLQSDRPADEVGALSASLPDLCILYKLHLECPHYINLYDWLQAFSAVLGERQDAAAPSRAMQARFAIGVAELHFLGLVKATNRKTDHVVRLTWGAC